MSYPTAVNPEKFCSLAQTFEDLLPFNATDWFGSCFGRLFNLLKRRIFLDEFPMKSRRCFNFSISSTTYCSTGNADVFSSGIHSLKNFLRLDTTDDFAAFLLRILFAWFV